MKDLPDDRVKTMKIAKLLAIIIMCITLAACGSELHDCKVVDKEYQPGMTILLPVYNGKSIQLIPSYQPERYYLIIEGVDEEGSAHSYKEQVSPIDYEQIKIGQEWEDRQ